MVTFCLVAGLVLLFVGGEVLVRGAVGTARAFAVSPLLIGLTIVAMATSAPELVVSLEAALQNRPAIAIGNVVGSNIANVLLILGVASLIAALPCERAMVMRDGMMMVVGSVTLVILGFTGAIDRWQGVLLFVLLLGFIGYGFYKERSGKDAAAKLHEEEAEEIPSPPGGTLGSIVALLIGLVMLVVGAQLLVYGATETARSFGVSEAVIGLTLVAVGTSLPELASVSVAVWRGHADVAIGTVIGSNIFNIFGILGVTAVTKPIPIEPSFIDLDIWVMLASAVLLIPLMVTGGRVTRGEGSLLLVSYFCYIGWLYRFA
jgi:cation:H+ antiporter